MLLLINYIVCRRRLIYLNSFAIMLETINLLGGSQTFLGVIATLTILCILKNDGNFITKMLSLVFDRIQEQIKILSNKIKATSPETTEMKLLMRFLKEETDDELHNEGAKVLRDINNNIDEKSIEYMRLEGANKPLFDNISTCLEHIMAPFYSFLYCMIVFIFDEALRSDIPGKDIILSSLVIFTLFSFIFWILIWIHFFRTNSVDYQHIQRPKNLCILLKKCSEYIENQGYIKALTIRILVCLLILALALFAIYRGNLYEEVAKVFLGLALLIPGLIIGIAKYLAKEGKPEYTHVLIASHSLIALVVSTLLALLIHLSVDYFPQLEICLFRYDSLTWLKFSILFFALMNGIIFPFLFPYISYMALYRKVVLAEKDIAKMHKENGEKLKEFCKKIPLKP